MTAPKKPIRKGDDATVPLSSGPHRASPVGALLRAHVSGVEKTHRLASGTCVIGSSQDADFVITDRTVSRRHVELRVVAEGVAVRDLESRNGTFYLDQRIHEAVLSLGATLRVGKATVAIDLDPGFLDAPASFDGDSYRGVLGVSPAMRRLFALLVRLEGSLAPVLLEGESGAGKELVARALHQGSSVSGGPLVALNCGAFSRELLGSELFGHVRGAFTGALEPRKGAFESADGGTLFLDEVGELPLDVQPMLLRAVETGEVRALGTDRAKTVRVRLVTATNRDLAAEVKEGRFREDLFYRLGVVRLRVPPLRERPEDIEPLARRFAAEAGVTELPAHVVERLKARPWPGNARELRSAMQVYAALGSLPDPARASPAELDLALRESLDLGRPYADQKEELVERFTRIYLAELLARTGGNQSAAAKIAGLDRGWVGKLAAKYRL